MEKTYVPLQVNDPTLGPLCALSGSWQPGHGHGEKRHGDIHSNGRKSPVLSKNLHHDLEMLRFLCQSLQGNTATDQSVWRTPSLDCKSHMNQKGLHVLSGAVTLTQFLLLSRRPKNLLFPMPDSNGKRGRGQDIVRMGPFQTTAYLKDRSFSPQLNSEKATDKSDLGNPNVPCVLFLLMLQSPCMCLCLLWREARGSWRPSPWTWF